MENKKCAVGWYVTHQGKAYGPVAYEDLKYEVSLGRLRPRVDYVWRDGYKSWIHADEVEGLFSGQVKSPEQDEVIANLVDNYFEKKEWRGMSRRWFLVCAVALPMLMASGLVHVWDQIEESQRMPLLIVCYFLVTITFLFAVLLRLKNLAMSSMWVAALLLPVFQFWLGYRLFACPAGYEESKDMDNTGWLLAWVYWFPIAAMIGLVIFATVKGSDTLLRLLEGIIG